MTLFRALQILANVHTRDDDYVGFVIEVGASAAHPATWNAYTADRGEYVRAWEEVRRQIDMPTSIGLRTAAPYTGPARAGIEAQNGINDIYPGDPCPPGGWSKDR